MERTNKEKACWICGRVVDANATLGLCPNCLDQYGSVAAPAGLAILGFALKKGGKYLVPGLKQFAKMIIK